MFKIILEDNRGYMEFFEDVTRAKIIKIDNKNTLKIEYKEEKYNLFIPLVNIKMFFIINQETTEEYFRYEKQEKR